MQSVFIKNIVTMFKEKLSIEFAQFRLPSRITPTPTPVVPQHKPSASTSSTKRNDKIVLYTTGEEDPIGSGMSILKLLVRLHNVTFEERKCNKDPKYIKELEELVGSDKVELPMVIVNGKDLCGEEEVEGLEDLAIQLKQQLNTMKVSRRQIQDINEMMRNALMGNAIKNPSSKASFWDNYRM